MLAVMKTKQVKVVRPGSRAMGATTIALLGGLLIGAAPVVHGADSASVFMYHRFGEDAHPTTNTRTDQFEAHIKELTNGKYHPLGLPEITNALRRHKPVPANAIGISIDDAFKSVYTDAWPRLKAAGLPFTLFVSTDPIDDNASGYMTWDQLRELARAGVTIGSHGASHYHMAGSGMDKVKTEIAKSNARFVKELGKKPELFAYPYGEASVEVRAYMIREGFAAAFGQHSGGLHGDSDFHYLPRFAMNETYGDLSRIRLAGNALPLRVREITPADPKLTPAGNPPSYGFTVFGDALKNLQSLNCYAWGQGKTRLERLGRGRIEIRLEKKFPPGRARVNCTMPAGGGKWRWFGMQFYIPK